MGQYMPYSVIEYNANTTVIVIPHSSICSIDFIKAKEPTETLSSVYNRLSNKPQVLINGGLFTMSIGKNVMSFIDEGVEQNYQNGFEGMGIKAKDVTTLVYGHDKDGWKDFLTAYPMLIKDGQVLDSYAVANELNYTAARQTIGVTADGSLIIVTVDAPGIKFQELGKIMSLYGAVNAMCLDGGGSVRTMVEGKVVNSPTENRPIDNMVAVYLKEETLLYTDKQDISTWALDSVRLCTDLGIFIGDNKGKFHPKEALTREELACTLARLYNILTKES